MGFTIQAMRRPLEALGYRIVGELPVYGIFDRGAVGDRRDIMEAALNLGYSLAEALESTGS